MVSGPLGLSVGHRQVRAVLLTRHRDAIDWAGAAEWETVDELSEAIGRLAADTARPVRSVRVVLERDVIQTRTIDPAPRLGERAVRRYVALEASRLFRKNGAPLVTDAAIITVDGSRRALWAVAVSEPVVQAVLQGCSAAGLNVEGIGPAAEILRFAAEYNDSAEMVFPNSSSAEVLSVGQGGTWRSRLIPSSSVAPPAWLASLGALGAEAGHFASAFAATSHATGLSLLPADARAARTLVRRRRVVRLFVLAAVLWCVAAATYALRLRASAVAAQREIAAAKAAVDSAIAERRDLTAGRATLSAFIGAERRRSRELAVVAAISQALRDSSYVVSLRVSQDSVVRLSGYARSAVRVVASLAHLSVLRDVRLEGPVGKEQGAGSTQLERFAIAARVDPR